MEVDAACETPSFLEVGGDHLLVIRTDPPVGSPRRDVGVVLLQGGAVRNVCFERNRVAVHEARRLAALGFPVLRFDYAGIGDSTGEVEGFDINDPPSDQVAAVLAHAQDSGMDRLVLVAVCMGARTALVTAAGVPAVVGVLVGAMPTAVRSVERRAAEWRMLRYVARDRGPRLRRLLDPERRRQFLRLVWRRGRAWVQGLLPRRRRALPPWVSRPMVDAVEHLLGRGVPVCFVYGQQDPLARDFAEAREGRFGAILERHGEQVEVHTGFAGTLHGFPTLAAQEHFSQVAEAWITRRFATPDTRSTTAVAS